MIYVGVINEFSFFKKIDISPIFIHIVILIFNNIGVTAEMAESGSTLKTCLNEIDRCRPFFVGFLGTRYGWCPPSYDSALVDKDDDEAPLAWLRQYPAHRSVTELEFQHGALRAPQHARACFYIRDQRFMHDVPEHLQKNFAPVDRDAYAK